MGSGDFFQCNFVACSGNFDCGGQSFVLVKYCKDYVPANVHVHVLYRNDLFLLHDKLLGFEKKVDDSDY